MAMRDTDDVKGPAPPPPPGQQPQRQGISPELRKELDALQSGESGADVDDRLRDNDGRLPDFVDTRDADTAEFMSFRDGFSPPGSNSKENEAFLSGGSNAKEPPERPHAGAQGVPPSPPGSVGIEPPESDPGPPQLSVVREAAQAETIAAKDALNREALTLAVANLLATRQDKHPLAMALFGAWGSGKSSFIDFVKKELGGRQTPAFRFADFNAWSNERVDNIGAALAQSVVESLVVDRGFFGQVRLALGLAKMRRARLRKALAKDTSRLWAWLQGAWLWTSTALVYFAWPIAVLLVVIGLLVGTDFSKWLVGTVGGAATSLAAIFSFKGVLSKELLEWFKKLATDQKFSFLLLPDYAEKLGSFHEVGRTLDDLCALTLSASKAPGGEFLLLVVDDLDRCSPDTIKQVFDAVRLVANIPHVVVLVALDERIAYSAVAKHYAEYGFSDRETAQVARDYMSKVFNVFVSLPGPQEESINNYVLTRLFGQAAQKASDNGEQTRTGATTTTPTRRREPTETSSKLEAQTFAALAGQFGLNNPRELWRLRQTWSLLKGFALPEHATDQEVRAWMKHMFFREVFLRGTAEQRKSGKPFLEQLAATSPSATERLWTDVLTSTARELAPGFIARDAAVMSVLLPAAPAELKAPSKS